MSRVRKGSVFRTASGWGFIVDVAPPGAPKRDQRRRTGFRTRRDATDALHSLQQEAITTGLAPIGPSVTLRRFVEDVYLPYATAKGLKPSTIESYSRNLRVHLLPLLGDYPLAAITTPTIDAAYARIREQRALKPASMERIHQCLSGVLKHGVRKGLITANPCDRADKPTRSATRSPRPTTLTPVEFRQLLASLETDVHYPLWRLFATTGMRRGEALGLKWSDVDLDSGTLEIRRSLGIVEGRICETSPKTRAGSRTVVLDAETVRVLRSHRRRQREDGLRLGVVPSSDRWVFAKLDGGPLNPNSVYKLFVNRVRAAGIRHVSIHQLRHTWATLAIANGAPIKVVSERVGHNDIATTLALYVHTDPSQHADAAERVARLLDSHG